MRTRLAAGFKVRGWAILFSATVCSVGLHVFAGCSSGDVGNRSEVRDSAGVRIVLNAGPEWAEEDWIKVGPEPEVTIGALEGPEEQQLFRVADAARTPDGGLAVLNSGASELRVYDASGGHKRTVGGKGSGPGEFQSPRWLVVRHDTLVVFDPFQDSGRISYFTLTGDFLTSRSLSVDGIPYPDPVTMLSDGTLLDTRGEASIGPMEVGHVRFTNIPVRYPPSGSSVDTIVSVPGTELYREEFRGGMSQSAVPFGRRESTAAGPGRIYLGNGDESAIEVFDFLGRHLMSVRFPRNAAEVTPDLVQRWIEATLEHPIYRARPDAAQRARRRFNETPVPNSMPAYGEIRVDHVERLWVRRYAPPWEDSNSWMVFDKDGVWLCDVDLPQGLQVFEIGEGYVLGLSQDELDVEYVQLFSLFGGGEKEK